MSNSYDLTRLSSEAFENMVNFLAMKTIGLGATGFAPGADGGRDGYFEGEASYPSAANRWKGIWYIQSKFHKPHLSANSQAWLIQKVKEELAEFDKHNSQRHWPNNWIICTNIDPSGVPQTGCFDSIRAILAEHPRGKNVNFHIWGGKKILDLLEVNNDVVRSYRDLLTPGHVISSLYAELESQHELRPNISELLRYFVVTQFTDQIYTKLDRASSALNDRPKVHDLFIDLPFSVGDNKGEGILEHLCSASAQSLRYSHRKEIPDSWRSWSKNVKRARVLLIKGGPGQGKSTITQYLCQIHRAVLILEDDGPSVLDSIRDSAKSIVTIAKNQGFIPVNARVPIQIELKEYAYWHSKQDVEHSRSILTYLSVIASKHIGEKINSILIKRTLEKKSWILIFDGLDEVPTDHKDSVAKEVMHFLDDVVIELDADILAICTSRPQGYSGQFANIDGPQVVLSRLDIKTAIRCATPLLKFGVAQTDSDKSIEILKTAISNPSVQELMTTPLQSHIMAMVIRDGGHPPEKRWRLFESFYQIMKRRESLKDFKDPAVAKLLRDEDRLLKAVHMRLGFILHARAEDSSGAQTVLSKEEFKQLVTDVVISLDDEDVEKTVDVVMEATTERLVLVSTPDNGDQVRFDIRQLQEYFAAEYLYDGLLPSEIGERIKIIGIDAHWREVMHFLLSALITDRRIAEFAVVVQELQKLNEGDSHLYNETYSRRTAPAAFLALRLLCEGVLEEDVNDRKNIKPLFAALSGASIQPNLDTLSEIRSPKSRRWVIVQLMDRVRILKSEEAISAYYILGLMADDGVVVREMSESLLLSPLWVQEYIIDSWCPDYDWEDYSGEPERVYSSQRLKLWVHVFALKILSSENWLNYGYKTIDTLMHIIRSDPDNFNEAAKSLDWSESTIYALNLFLHYDDRLGNTASEERISCGIVSAELFEASWLSGKSLENMDGIDATLEVDRTGGIIRLMFLCLSFSKNKSMKTLVKFYQYAHKADRRCIMAIPDYLIALMPIGNWQDINPCSIERLSTLKETSSLDEFLRNSTSSIHLPITGTTIFSGSGKIDQNRLTEILPETAVDLCFGVGTFASRVENFEWTSKIFDIILIRYKYAARHILNMGVINSKNKKYFDNLIRKISMLGDDEINKIIFQKGICGFPINLSLDSSVIRIFAPALVSYWVLYTEEIFELPERFDFFDPLRHIVSEFSLDFEVLREFVKSNAFNSEKSGALAISWLLWSEMATNDKATSNFDLEKEMNLYKDLWTRENSGWLTQAAVIFLGLFSKEDKLALKFCNYMLDVNTHPNALNSLTKLTITWEERSQAPVLSGEVMRSWLGLQKAIPSYLATLV